MWSRIVSFKEIWIVARGMQSYFPELISTSTSRPDLYHSFNICLHAFVCAFRLFSFCLFLCVALTILVLRKFLTFKKGNVVSMLILYLWAVSSVGILLLTPSFTSCWTWSIHRQPSHIPGMVNSCYVASQGRNPISEWFNTKPTHYNSKQSCGRWSGWADRPAHLNQRLGGWQPS